MKTSLLRILILLVVIAFIVLVAQNCKKVDLDRIALVKTLNVSNVTTNSASVSGEIIDAGEQVKSYGFVVATFQNPTITDQKVVSGTSAQTGNFSGMVSGLSQNTNYWVRSYVEGENETVYGDNLSFKTVAGTSSAWLNYDNGQNADGIGLLEGGSFDVAIRFTPAQLAPYNGFRVTKIKFFPRMYYSSQFSVEIFTGSSLDAMSLSYFEDVNSPVPDQWNEVILESGFQIDASQEMLVGYWIYGQTAGYYPAGIDSGPANVGYGDLISLDDGVTWSSLTQSSTFNGNWNIQVFVTNEAGKEFKIGHLPGPPSRKSGAVKGSPKISSFSSSQR
ncbi:MAG: hypothetical protein IH598_04860 [Bacteroidales bacterium]|nr:hypothetical protein [Bacteroidales bacterium]